MRLDRYDQGGYAGGGITENGGNISGPLVLAGNPSQTLEAVPKQYVDAYFNSLNASNLTAGTLAAARLPNFTGDLQSVAGTSQLTLANSGITPGEYGKVTVNAKGIVTSGGDISDTDIPFGLGWEKINPATLPSTLAGYGITNAVSVSGGTLTGFLSVTNQPTLGTHVATKQYVDALVSSGGIAVGDILRKPYSNTPVGFLKCNGAEVDKTTFADLYSVIGDQYRQNTVPGNGKPWTQQYQLNTTQSTDITGWTTDTTLPGALYASAVIVTKNRVYFCGGTNGTNYVTTVYTAPINADGTLGSWTTGTSLPGALGVSQAIVTKNRVYLLGGETASSVASTIIYTAVINADGTLGGWSTAGELPGPLAMSQAIVTKNRVYLLGGTSANVYNVTVYTAVINSDGSIGTWTTGGSLPAALGFSQAVVTKNRVYLLGGRNATTLFSTVYTAPINTDGTLGGWSTAGELPGPLAMSQAIVTKNRVYLLGGATASGTYVSAVYSAPINIDGTLGTWVTGTSLPSNLSISQAIVTKNRVYMLGGWNGTAAQSTVYTAPINGGLNDYSPYYAEDTTNYMMPGSGRPWEQQYQINTTQTTNITGWTAGPSLPNSTFSTPVIVTKNRVYIIGSWNGSSYFGTVYSAAVNTDGSLGAWVTETSTPIVQITTPIIIKNRVYLIGGYTTSGLTSAIYYAPINADGTLGTWVSAGSLPLAIASSVIVTGNRVYMLGCSNGSVLANTYSAPINSDGSLGAWVAGNNLPVAMNCTPFITRNRVYLVGCDTTGSISTNLVYTASINSDGYIGTWTSYANLPDIISRNAVFVTKNRVYLIGGRYDQAYVNTVYTALINDDGTLGSWSTGTALPQTYCYGRVFVVKNKIYLVSGATGPGYTTSTYMASISSDIQDYSPYYDGTIVPNNLPDASTKFTLPDLSADEPFGSYSYIKY